MHGFLSGRTSSDKNRHWQCLISVASPPLHMGGLWGAAAALGEGHIMEGLCAGGCKKGSKQENMLVLINNSLLFCFEAFVHCLNYSSGLLSSLWSDVKTLRLFK